ncbi:MAG: periplasmic heavy metal sensor [Bacteroidetes bacterium]|nr:periplasmic heavy metal sensor [Bacteroidota bacterium]
MKNATFTLLITTLLLLGFTTETNAQKGNWEKKEMLKEKLNLTDSQESQMKDLRYEHQKQILDLRSDLEKNKLEIKHMMATNKIDENLLKGLTKKSSDLRGEINQLRVDHWLKVYNILDADQQEIWTKSFDRMGNHKNGRGPKSGKQGMGMDMNRKGGNREFGDRPFHKGF